MTSADEIESRCSGFFYRGVEYRVSSTPKGLWMAHIRPDGGSWHLAWDCAFHTRAAAVEHIKAAIDDMLNERPG